MLYNYDNFIYTYETYVTWLFFVTGSGDGALDSVSETCQISTRSSLERMRQ